MGAVIVTGSFDPFTSGHLDLVVRAKTVFGRVSAVMLINPEREYLFSKAARTEIAVASLSDIPFDVYDGETAEYCKKNNVSLIVRGIKSDDEYAYEREMARYNKAQAGVETLLLPMNLDISATAVRDALKDKRPLDGLVAESAKKIIEGYFYG